MSRDHELNFHKCKRTEKHKKYSLQLFSTKPVSKELYFFHPSDHVSAAELFL